jgi:hypothetical protein
MMVCTDGGGMLVGGQPIAKDHFADVGCGRRSTKLVLGKADNAIFKFMRMAGDDICV